MAVQLIIINLAIKLKEMAAVSDEIVQRMRTFNLIKWCGMPGELNPRRLAKSGFICIDKCLLQCSDLENCGQKVQLQYCLQFGVKNSDYSLILQRAVA